jgi:hypothetical protein
VGRHPRGFRRSVLPVLSYASRTVTCRTDRAPATFFTSLVFGFSYSSAASIVRDVPPITRKYFQRHVSRGN